MITQPKINEETADLLFMAWTDVIHNHGTGFTALSVVQVLKSALTYDIDGLDITEKIIQQFLEELAFSKRCINCNTAKPGVQINRDDCSECES